MAEARVCAEMMLSELRGRRVVLLGSGVARAFGLRCAPLVWCVLGPAEFAVLPHPSGVNLWWNKEENRRSARAFFSDLLIGRKP